MPVGRDGEAIDRFSGIAILKVVSMREQGLLVLHSNTLSSFQPEFTKDAAVKDIAVSSVPV